MNYKRRLRRKGIRCGIILGICGITIFSVNPVWAAEANDSIPGNMEAQEDTTEQISDNGAEVLEKDIVSMSGEDFQKDEFSEQEKKEETVENIVPNKQTEGDGEEGFQESENMMPSIEDAWNSLPSVNVPDGLQYDQNTDNWYMYKNGVIDTSYTGLAYNENGWWYVRDGGIDWNYTGFVENENGLWYVRGGEIDWNYTSVEYTGMEWLYIHNGGIDWNYTGLASNANGWWYIRNGKVDWEYTGLVSNANGWWYVREGGVDWSFTGLVSNENGYWYVRNGGIDWNYTGFAQNENGWWYVCNGGIDWNYTSVELNVDEWLYVKNGGVDWNYTGLAQNANGWWYIRNGKVDWSFTGLVFNENGYWYVRDGGVDWNYTGFAQNENGWWYVRNGGIDWNYTSVELNVNEWLYVKNGGVDWNYTGLAQNANGWWYIRNGKVDWNYTGVVENENGWWYVCNGGIDWNYNGTVYYKGQNRKIVNGAVDHYYSWVNNLNVSKECSQLIIVSVYNKTYAEVSMHTKNGYNWEDNFTVTGRIGSNGLGKEKEGDKKTPVGVYALHTPFGIKEDPGCPLDYIKVNENHYWSGEPAKYYNKLVDASKVSDYKQGGGEHLIDYPGVYNYCVAVDYNPECIVGKGSAIFLHCQGKGTTAGCISIPEEYMITVIQNLRRDAQIVIDYRESIMNY